MLQRLSLKLGATLPSLKLMKTLPNSRVQTIDILETRAENAENQQKMSKQKLTPENLKRHINIPNFWNFNKLIFFLDK